MTSQPNLDAANGLNPGAPGNQLGVAMSNTLGAINDQIAHWNANLIAEYKLKHDNWLVNATAHPDIPIPEPQPPMAWIVGSFTDPTSGPGMLGPYGGTPINWATPIQGTHPVCAPLPGLPVFSQGASTAAGGMMAALVAEGGAAAQASPFNASVALYVQQVTSPDGAVFVRVK